MPLIAFAVYWFFIRLPPFKYTWPSKVNCTTNSYLYQNFQANGTVDFTQCEQAFEYPMVVLSAELSEPFGNALYLMQAHGDVKAYGLNHHGQLWNITGGVPQSGGQTSALRVPDVVQIALGCGFSLYLSAAGSAYAAGANRACMFTTDSSCPDNPSDIPFSEVHPQGLNQILAVAAGESHALFLLSDGSVVGTGMVNSIQLQDGSTAFSGLGQTANTSMRAPATVFASCMSIAASAYASFCVGLDGTVTMKGALLMYTASRDAVPQPQVTALDPAATQTAVKVLFPIAAPVSRVVSGPLVNTVLFIHYNGSVTAMSPNMNGQLGNDDELPRRNGNLDILNVSQIFRASIGKEWSPDMNTGSNLEFILLLGLGPDGGTDIYGSGSNAHQQLADFAFPAGHRVVQLIQSLDTFDITHAAAGMSDALYVDRRGCLHPGGANSGGEMNFTAEAAHYELNPAYNYGMRSCLKA